MMSRNYCVEVLGNCVAWEVQGQLCNHYNYQCKQVQVHVTETSMHGSVFMITGTVDHVPNSNTFGTLDHNICDQDDAHDIAVDLSLEYSNRPRCLTAGFFPPYSITPF